MIYNISCFFCQSPAVCKGIHFIYLLSYFPFKRKCTIMFVLRFEWITFFVLFTPITNTIPEMRVHRPNNTMYISNPHFQIEGIFWELRLRCIISLRQVLCLMQMCTLEVSLYYRHHLWEPQGWKIFDEILGIYVNYRPVLKPKPPFLSQLAQC